MAKDRERKIAHDYYVYQGKTFKEISRITGVTEKTVGKWAAENGDAWKKERDAQLNGTPRRIEDIKKVISNLTEKRIDLAEQSKKAVQEGNKELRDALDNQAAKIALEVSYWNKALANLDKSSRISLEIYLEVMDMIFTDLRANDEKLFTLTLDFQENHIQYVSKRLG